MILKSAIRLTVIIWRRSGRKLNKNKERPRRRGGASKSGPSGLEEHPFGVLRLKASKKSAPKAQRSSSEALLTLSEATMVVGIGIITFRLHDCRSLKGKRKVVKSIISRLRNNFNASVAEIGSNDVHQRAEIGFSLVGNDQAIVNSKIDKMINLAEDLGLAEIIDTEMEIIHL
jgi:hypothetical protein